MSSDIERRIENLERRKRERVDNGPARPRPIRIVKMDEDIQTVEKEESRDTILLVPVDCSIPRPKKGEGI